MNSKMFRWQRYMSFAGVQLLVERDLDLFVLLRPGVNDPQSPGVVLISNLDLAKTLFDIECNAVILSYAEDGKVTYEESGRDCDCVEYSGRLHEGIDASYEAYLKLEREIREWTDGPFYLSLMKPSQAEEVVYESRDLVLEAMEDGHPHSIVSRFP